MMVDRVCWALLGLLHLPPALALLRPALIESLYGAVAGSPAFPLLQHRAALFAAIVTICLWAAVDRGIRRLASVVCAISMLSFVLLYLLSGSSPPLRTIALADMLFLPILALAGWRAFRA